MTTAITSLIPQSVCPYFSYRLERLSLTGPADLFRARTNAVVSFLSYPLLHSFLLSSPPSLPPLLLLPSILPPLPSPFPSYPPLTFNFSYIPLSLLHPLPFVLPSSPFPSHTPTPPPFPLSLSPCPPSPPSPSIYQGTWPLETSLARFVIHLLINPFLYTLFLYCLLWFVCWDV